MLSITRSTEKRNFDYRFDSDAFAQAHGFRDEAHFNATADLLAASFELTQLEREIEQSKTRIAALGAELEAMS